MNISQRARWQWAGYPRYHRSRANLVLHIVVVPVFLIANVTLVVALAERAWFTAVVALASMLVSVALQGSGHRQEPTPPEPFASPVNALLRIFLEQWVTFPRFASSGAWLRAIRAAP